MVVVRHGQATHNLPTFLPSEMVLTKEPDMPFMDSPLTALGLEQAELVAKRLAKTKFNLALASDLERAWLTGQAILKHNSSIDSAEQCRHLRERTMGVFEPHYNLVMAQITVEEAVPDRELLTWRIPKGESIVDLRNRVRQFLDLVQTRAMQLEEEVPIVLVATHCVWMHELHYVLSDWATSHGSSLMAKPRTPNTGVDQYRMVTAKREDRQQELLEVNVDFLSCDKHLEDRKSF